MEVQYFEDDQGRQPAREFIDGLDPKMRAKVFGRLLLLEEYGERLPMPFARHLEDGIFELRTPQGSNITRLLYFISLLAIALSSPTVSVKKTQRTPRKEIERAKKFREIWRSHNGRL